MTRLLLALGGVLLLALTALGLLWLIGEMLVGVGLLAVGTAGVLARLLWFLVWAGVLGAVVYFVASAWRPPKVTNASASKVVFTADPSDATAPSSQHETGSTSPHSASDKV